jgi:ParB family chromosome partitioning protein
VSSKNRGFAAGLLGAVETADSPRGAAGRAGERSGVGALAGRNNRLAELASGALVSRAQELVDPGRCRMWAEHNRDYAALNEANCAELIESLKAQGSKRRQPSCVGCLANRPTISR